MAGELGYRGVARRELCRDLRQNAASAEEQFWQLVRGRRFEGLKFRRQQAIGTFIADFCCVERNLVVELDGGVHDDLDQQERDLAREAILAEHGWRVFRIANADLVANPERVLQYLRSFLSPSPAHLERGPRGEAPAP